MGNLLNVLNIMSATAFKIITFIVPAQVMQPEKAIKTFRREVPVWMDEDYL